MKNIFKSSNIITILIILSAVTSLYFLWKSVVDIRMRNILDKKTPASITDWQINEKDEGIYFIGVSYNYSVDNKKHEGKTIFSKQKFLNYYAALDTISKLSKQDLMVWYSSKNIHLSTIDYRFQVKNLLYFFIAISVLFYFVLLKNNMIKS